MTASAMPPTASSTKIANTGYSTHRRSRLRSEARALITMKTTSTTRASGQIQERIPIMSVEGCMTIKPRPTKPIDAAGTYAQRCGWSVNRVERIASSPQPRPNASRTDPVIVASLPPATGPVTRNMATASPAICDPTMLMNRRGELPCRLGLVVNAVSFDACSGSARASSRPTP